MLKVTAKDEKAIKGSQDEKMNRILFPGYQIPRAADETSAPNSNV